MATETPRRERKVVTVLFCDLVGFTSRAEAMDPEDVEALLRPYHQRVREELERHGGTVEKFIGDAVMALFGAPVSHEDDPERAVRAAIAIRDFAVEGGLELRVGITTGEALVSLDARPDAGEGMASGDVVNTAARLQSAAPVNGVIVDETTYRATRHAIDYADVEPVEAKGKAEPITVWKAMHAHSRFGVDIAHEARSELVGRERELAAVRDVFDRARHARTSQLLTLVGVPGIGKSRLVYELSRIVDADAELITWRQGRCLAYGDGITLWALAEIVKAQAGIVEQDSPGDVVEKLGRSAADVLPASDASWVESHLLALVGLAEEAEIGGDRRNEAFSAWRRFLEGLAEQRPLVLVFEDLHWADEALLDFVDELVDWVTDVPLLVVATARPELLERRPNWGGGKLNATTLALAPLSDQETALLLARVLGRSVLPADTQQALLERAGGNPLYAEQFVELYLERGSADELRMPETLQGIIAARLDGLAADEKNLLLDAAVIGKVFWGGALGRGPHETAAALHALERKGFVRRQRQSSVEGETELAFAHALVRDVAYGMIPRADRASKHRRVADWIESLGRPEDHAEMRAYHLVSALELAQASGQPRDDLADRARAALRDAGDRAFALSSFSAAERYYAQALALSREDDPDRPEVLFRRAHALYYVSDGRQEDALVEARDAALAAGDTERAAEAEAILAYAVWHLGRRDDVKRFLVRATELATGAPSRARARVLAVAARLHMLTGEPETGIRIAEEALETSRALGLEELSAHALTTIGSSKNILNDRAGYEELERARELALSIDSPLAATITNNLAVAADGEPDGGLVRSEELYFESVRLAERFGDAEGLRFISANLTWLHWVRGRWDESLAAADDFIAQCEAGSTHVLEPYRRINRAAVRLGRGDIDGALADMRRARGQAREAGDTQTLTDILVFTAGAFAELGMWDEVRAHLEDIVPLIREHPEVAGWESLVAPAAEKLGLRAALQEVVANARPSVWVDAATRALDLDLSGAADVYSRMGSPTLEAMMRSAAGALLIETGHRAEGEAELEKALAFWRSVGATWYAERDEALLREAKTA